MEASIRQSRDHNKGPHQPVVARHARDYGSTGDEHPVFEVMAFKGYVRL
jgi:hypothetical protein